MQRVKGRLTRSRQRRPRADQTVQARPRAILYWRVKHGYTLFDMAARTQLSAATLCRIELGGAVSMRTRIRLMDQLRLDAEELEELLQPARLDGTRVSREERALGPEELSKRRRRLKLSVRELAARVGVKIATIYRAESGSERVQARTRMRIGRALEQLEGK